LLLLFAKIWPQHRFLRKTPIFSTIGKYRRKLWSYHRPLECLTVPT
jgi:hypothetical protein